MTMSNLVNTGSIADTSFNLDWRYTRRLIPDPSGGFTATIHELPGCIAEGDTADEALSNLESAAQSWMESAKSNGYPITPPIDYEGASGKIALRISKRIHQLAAERAEMEGISLNQFIGNALSSYLGQQDGMKRIAEHLEAALTDGIRATYARFYEASIVRETSSARKVFISQTDYLTHESSSSNKLFLNIHDVVRS